MCFKEEMQNNNTQVPYGLDVMTLAAHSLKSCLSLFLDTGVPVLTFRIEPRGIFICESDSSQSIVVSSSFARHSFHRFKTPRDERVVFSVDTTSIVQCLKTATSSCSVQFGFEGCGGSGEGDQAEGGLVPRKLVVVRTVDNKTVDEAVNNPAASRLAFRHKIDILKCPPSQVLFDMEPIRAAAMQGLQLSFVIRHSTLSSIVKEFGRLHRREFFVSSRGSDSVLFSSDAPKHVGIDDGGGDDGSNAKDHGQQLEVVLCDPQWCDSAGDEMGTALGGVDVELNDHNRMIAGMARPRQGFVIYGRFNLKILSRALKTQCSKEVQLFLIPPAMSTSEPPPSVVDDAVLVVRQEPLCLGEINVVVPSSS